MSLLEIPKEGQPPQRHCLTPNHEEIGPPNIQQEGSSHPSTIIMSHLWERPVIHLNVEIADHLSGVPPFEQVYAQLNGRLIL